MTAVAAAAAGTAAAATAITAQTPPPSQSGTQALGHSGSLQPYDVSPTVRALFYGSGVSGAGGRVGGGGTGGGGGEEGCLTGAGLGKKTDPSCSNKLFIARTAETSLKRFENRRLSWIFSR